MIQKLILCLILLLLAQQTTAQLGEYDIQQKGHDRNDSFADCGEFMGFQVLRNMVKIKHGSDAVTLFGGAFIPHNSDYQDHGYGLITKVEGEGDSIYLLTARHLVISDRRMRLDLNQFKFSFHKFTNLDDYKIEFQLKKSANTQDSLLLGESLYKKYVVYENDKLDWCILKLPYTGKKNCEIIEECLEGPHQPSENCFSYPLYGVRDIPLTADKITLSESHFDTAGRNLIYPQDARYLSTQDTKLKALGKSGMPVTGPYGIAGMFISTNPSGSTGGSSDPRPEMVSLQSIWKELEQNKLAAKCWNLRYVTDQHITILAEKLFRENPTKFDNNWKIIACCYRPALCGNPGSTSNPDPSTSQPSASVGSTSETSENPNTNRGKGTGLDFSKHPPSGVTTAANDWNKHLIKIAETAKIEAERIAEAKTKENEKLTKANRSLIHQRDSVIYQLHPLFGTVGQYHALELLPTSPRGVTGFEEILDFGKQFLAEHHAVAFDSLVWVGTADWAGLPDGRMYDLSPYYDAKNEAPNADTLYYYHLFGPQAIPDSLILTGNSVQVLQNHELAVLRCAIVSILIQKFFPRSILSKQCTLGIETTTERSDTRRIVYCLLFQRSYEKGIDVED